MYNLYIQLYYLNEEHNLKSKYSKYVNVNLIYLSNLTHNIEIQLSNTTDELVLIYIHYLLNNFVKNIVLKLFVTINNNKKFNKNINKIIKSKLDVATYELYRIEIDNNFRKYTSTNIKNISNTLLDIFNRIYKINNYIKKNTIYLIN